jgi:hypothetical protein
MGTGVWAGEGYLIRSLYIAKKKRWTKRQNEKNRGSLYLSF